MVLSYREALNQTTEGKRHLLLGNGFSMAWRATVFSYASLREQADFSAIHDPEALFQAAESNDFEIVIRGLQQSARFLEVYRPEETATAARMRADAEELKAILVRAIAENHPELPTAVTPEAYAACRAFLSSFDRIYTLNYDLLLYWALMQDAVDTRNIRCDDGFRNPDNGDDADYVAWEDYKSANVHFLHGALHIFDSGIELQKYTWLRTGIPLIEQIRAALSRDLFPLFVAEGDSSMKRERINHSAYLHKALRSFSEISGDLFIYGHSLAASDEHILRRIERGRVRRAYISIYGDPGTPTNRQIIERGRLMADRRAALSRRNSLEVKFFDAASAQVWGA
jgi:hypothetical protein